MVIYLPMKRKIRTKVKITNDGKLLVYQQNRNNTLTFTFWKKIDLTPDVNTAVLKILEQRKNS